MIEFFGNLKQIASSFLQKLQTLLQKIRASVQNIKKPASFWKPLIIGGAAVICLYYPLGGLMIDNIDTSSTYRPQNQNGKLASADMAAYLINREVHHKIWTPNLPFLFPSYFLDNMPNFQLGLMSAVSKTVSAISRAQITTVSQSAVDNLKESAELLQYPGNVWLFSPQNNLIPAPSSATQYKKGRKKLNIFNEAVAEGKVVFEHSPQNLSLILKTIRKDIRSLILKTENHIFENNTSFFDFKADDTFYFAQGKLYAYSQLLRGLGLDFKTVLIKYDIYPQWTTALKLLKDASDLNPTIVHNGKLNSSFAPNHLTTINYFASRTLNRLDNMINKLDKNTEK